MINIVLKPGGKATRIVIMKKDSELPWVIRIARWGALILFLAYGTVKVIKEAEGLFL